VNSSCATAPTDHSEARIDVAIPTWNRADTLVASIESALNQDVPVTVHVYDNGSDDDTVARLRQIQDERLVVHRWEENRGRFLNFDRAFSSGDSPYVLLLFDDEILLPGSLRVLQETLDADPTLVYAHGDVVIRNEHGDTFFTGLYGSVSVPARLEGLDFIRKSFRSGCYAWFNSTLFRRSMIEGIRFDPRDSPLDDVGVLLRAATRGAVGYVSHPIATRTDGNLGEARREGLVTSDINGSDGFTIEGSILMQRPFERFLLRHRDLFTPQERASLVRRVHRVTAWHLGKAAADRIRQHPLRALTGRDAPLLELLAWTGGLRAKLQLFRSALHYSLKPRDRW
jgi:glycosyltransferase involved in cell wall biosynthesis